MNTLLGKTANEGLGVLGARVLDADTRSVIDDYRKLHSQTLAKIKDIEAEGLDRIDRVNAHTDLLDRLYDIEDSYEAAGLHQITPLNWVQERV